MSSPSASANLLGGGPISNNGSNNAVNPPLLSSDLLGASDTAHSDFQRPASEILGTGAPVGASGLPYNHAALAAATQAGRPASEVINKNFKSPEAEAIDRLFEDLNYYENTLEEMAQARLDDNFCEELKAIEQWFSVLSSCERTTALYSLLQQATPVQIRFFITVLQQMAQKETPGNENKGYERDYLYPPKSPGLGGARGKFYPRHSAPIDDYSPFNAGRRLSTNDGDNVYHHPHRGDGNNSFNYNRRGSTHSLKGKDDMMKAKNQLADLEMTGMNNTQGWALNNFSMGGNGGAGGGNLRERTSSLQPNGGGNGPNNNYNHGKGGNGNGMHINTKRSFNKMASPKAKSPAFPKPLSPLISFNNSDMPPISPGGSNSNKWENRSNRGGSYAHSEYSENDEERKYHRAGSTAGSTTAGSVSGKDKGKIPDKIELELLEDIPSWLRSLRLHKYTPLFEKMAWKDMVVLNDEELTQKGVAALGARRKLSKVFAMVKEECKKQNIELPKHEETEKTAENKEQTKSEGTTEQNKTENSNATAPATTNNTTTAQETTKNETSETTANPTS